MRLDCGSCVVRDWRAGDRAALLQYANNRRVWRNLKNRFPHPYTAADADAWLALARTDPQRTGWAIDVNGIAVGGIGLVPGEDVHAKSAHIGYWLGEPYWGRGIMTDAVRAVSGHALAVLGFRRREAVLKKSIFKDGQLIDCMLYSRLAP